MDPNIFRANPQIQSGFVSGTPTYSYEGYATDSVTYVPGGSHGYQYGVTINQPTRDARDHPAQLYGQPIIHNLSSFHGGFQANTTNSVQHAHHPVFMSNTTSLPTVPVYPSANPQSAASSTMAPTSIPQSNFTTATLSRVQYSGSKRAAEATEARQVDEVRSIPRINRATAFLLSH
jgi:hypothetical protein